MRNLVWGIASSIPLAAAAAQAAPRFTASYDSSLTADFALGNPVPLSVGNSVIDPVEFKYGGGALNPSANTSGGNRLSYATAGNFVMGPNTAGTIEMWVKTSWQGDTRQVLFSMYQPGFVGTVELNLEPNGVVRAILDTFSSGGGVWFQQFGGGELTDGNYHHLAWNWDLSFADPADDYSTMFLNGVPQTFAGFGTLQYPGTVGANFEIGSHQGGFDALQGRIDDFRFSDNAVYGQTGFTPPGPFVVTPTWNVGGGGNWSDSANWQSGQVPNAAGAVAVFGPAATGPATVTVDIPVTVGTVRFNNANRYTIAGTNTLTLDSTSGPAVLNVIAGSHTISAPLMMADDTSVTVGPSEAVLTVSNLQDAAGRTVTKAGAGKVELNRVRGDGLVINAGTVAILPNGTSAATSNVKTLTIAGGTTPTAKLDVANNAVVVDYSVADPDPFDTIKAQIVSAYNGGSWNGNGIGSSLANATTHAVGYAQASALTAVPAIFGSVDNTAVLIRGTRYGDADLSGTVNLQDFNRLAANFGAANAVWSQGDFDYNGTVNLQDFNRLAANFGQSATGIGGTPTPEDWANLASAIPEPGAGGSILFAVAIAMSRRRRTQTMID